MDRQPDKKVYFPGLNGLRAYASIMVVVSHCEAFKYWAGLDNFYDYSWIKSSAHVGVKMFFVLSGFLITYLLLKEKARTKDVNIRFFYMRRVLRIWPLYFLVLLLAVLLPFLGIQPDYFPEEISPHAGFKIGLSIFLLPNLIFYLFGHIWMLGPLWSIGAEEQFYLIYPWLYKLKKAISKVLLLALFVIISFKILTFGFLAANRLLELMIPEEAVIILNISNKLLVFDCMIIGGLFAVCLETRMQIINTIVYKKGIQILALLLVLFFIFYDMRNAALYNFIISFAFGVIIVNTATNGNAILKLNSRIENELGKISYGIYLWHSISIACMIFLAQRLDSQIFNQILIVPSLLLTVAISYFSFNYYENPILRIKKRYSKI